MSKHRYVPCQKCGMLLGQRGAMHVCDHSKELGELRATLADVREDRDNVRAALGKTRGILYSWLFGYNSDEEIGFEPDVLAAETETVLVQTTADALTAEQNKAAENELAFRKVISADRVRIIPQPTQATEPGPAGDSDQSD